MHDSMTNDFAVIDENLRAAMRFFGYATGTGEIAPVPGGIAMYSGLEYGVFNIAMLDGRVSQTGLTLEERLVGIAQYFKPKTARWSLWLCDDLLDYATRRRARQTLSDFGMRAISHPPGMIAPALLPPNNTLPPVDVQAVKDKASQDAFTEITSICFEIPFGVAQAVYAQEHAWHGDYRGFVGVAAGRVHPAGRDGIAEGPLPPGQPRGDAGRDIGILVRDRHGDLRVGLGRHVSSTPGSPARRCW